MIIGSGSDLIDIRRIEKTLARFGDRFIARISTPAERAKAVRRRVVGNALAVTYATRSAAKEATANALVTGFRAGVFWRDLGVVNTPTGKPTVVMTFSSVARLRALLPPGMYAQVDLSLTDE